MMGRSAVPAALIRPPGCTTSVPRVFRSPRIVVPGSIGTEGEQSVVYITAAARPIYADMKKDGIVARKNLPPSPTAGE